MTGKQNKPATSELPGGPPEVPPPVTAHPDLVRAEISLASYVDALLPADFSDEARAVFMSEVKGFSLELRNKTTAHQELDDNAESALRKHVRSAIRSVYQSKSEIENPENGSKVSDWCKWIGFFIAAFAVNQFTRVTGEKPILKGSVNWLVVEIIVTIVLLMIGFMIDKPLKSAKRFFRKTKKRQQLPEYGSGS